MGPLYLNRSFIFISVPLCSTKSFGTSIQYGSSIPAYDVHTLYTYHRTASIECTQYEASVAGCTCTDISAMHVLALTMHFMLDAINLGVVGLVASPVTLGI